MTRTPKAPRRRKCQICQRELKLYYFYSNGKELTSTCKLCRDVEKMRIQQEKEEHALIKQQQFEDTLSTLVRKKGSTIGEEYENVLHQISENVGGASGFAKIATEALNRAQGLQADGTPPPPEAVEDPNNHQYRYRHREVAEWMKLILTHMREHSKTESFNEWNKMDQEQLRAALFDTAVTMLREDKDFRITVFRNLLVNVYEFREEMTELLFPGEMVVDEAE